MTTTSTGVRSGLRQPVEVRSVDVRHVADLTAGAAHTKGASMSGSLVITIDGPAATGKTSVAHALAKRIGFEFLDTGAMYRAAALLAIESGAFAPGRPLLPADESPIVLAVDAVRMEFDWACDPPALQCNGRTVMDRIRDDDVTAIVSPVAGVRTLREIMVGKQRLIADHHPRLVTEGRDQGAVVFPHAPVKFFLDGDPLVRAARRREQIIERRNASGVTEPVQDLEAIAEDLVARDRADAAAGRLLRPIDAIVVDTGTMTFKQVVDLLTSHATAAIGLQRRT